MALNPCDLADLLCASGMLVDYDTGEIEHEVDDESLLILLAAMGKLDVQCHPYTNEKPTFYITDLTISDMESYCEVYPDDPQCRIYDV